MPILHTVYFRLRDDDGDVEARIPECVALFNEHKGITASVVKGTYHAVVCGLAAPADAVFTHVEVPTLTLTLTLTLIPTLSQPQP